MHLLLIKLSIRVEEDDGWVLQVLGGTIPHLF
jgi:hypothetical protein